MKTRILTIAMVALMMGIAINLRAEEGDTNSRTAPVVAKTFNASINLFPDDVVKFHVVNPGQEKVKLRITDERGTTLYTYILKKEKAVSIGFDVSKLEAGKYNYTIVKNKKEVLRKTIVKAD
jgi:hypothetical protein